MLHAVMSSRLNFVAAHPDRYELMRVGLAKGPIHSKSIQEQVLHLATAIGKMKEHLMHTRVPEGGATKIGWHCSKILFLGKYF
jgi:hypothetical protein